MTFTNAQKMKCAERELEKRRQVYPKWVDKGRMRKSQMDYELAVMEEIAADYRAKVDEAEAESDLFKGL